MEEKKREELSFASCFDLAALLEVAMSTKWRISPAAATWGYFSYSVEGFLWQSLRTKNAFLNGVKNLAAIFTEGLVGGDLIGGDLELGNLTRGALEGGGEVLEWGEVFCDCGESLAEGRDALRAEGRGGEGGEGRERVSEIFEAVIALGEVFKTGEMGDVFEFGEGGVRGLQEVGGDT